MCINGVVAPTLRKDHPRHPVIGEETVIQTLNGIHNGVVNALYVLNGGAIFLQE
jgi:hypothetical protein